MLFIYNRTMYIILYNTYYIYNSDLYIIYIYALANNYEYAGSFIFTSGN